ncbi:MAG: hypothetical protein ABJE95_10195 [Byssovorax sp.]
MVRSAADRCRGSCAAAALALAAGACAPASAPGATEAPGDPEALDAIDAELTALAQGVTSAHRDTFRSILDDTIAKDPYACHPSPRAVFFGPAPDGERIIAGDLPHYGFFFGPMHYRIAHAGGRFRVKVTVAVAPPAGLVSLELPDCGLVREVGGDERRCSGTPYAESPKTEACPGSGSFAIDASPAHVRALLARWSREASRYYTRDARAFGLPVDYDFAFVLEGGGAARGADLTVALSPTCGRTPYFSAFRSGWSLPIVAHEVGHVLGLLDEYEAFSGLSSLYPKTPFPGAEVSRMGLSMREGTRVLPLHHYLIVRRYFCAEPRRGGFWADQPL